MTRTRLSRLVFLLSLVTCCAYADEAPVTDPAQLLNQARTLVQQHQYDEARKIYSDLLKQETGEKSQHDLLIRERDYVLPYYEALYFLDEAKLDKARTIIVHALRANQKFPERQRSLRELGVEILRTQEDRGDEGAPLEDSVSRTVEDKLKQYFYDNEVFPLNYKELNKLLPPEQGVLRWYDVIDYVGSRERCRIRLRNRKQHAQVLDLSVGPLLR